MLVSQRYIWDISGTHSEIKPEYVCKEINKTVQKCQMNLDKGIWSSNATSRPKSGWCPLRNCRGPIDQP
jgi:hypothetical protein